MVCRLAEAVDGARLCRLVGRGIARPLSYGEVITEKIGEAKATLVVWSRDSAASEWVRAEADMARNQKKLIQTAIDDCTPPLPFNQIQYAALGDWTGEADHPGWRKVRASLAALCGPAPAEAGPGPSLPPVAKLPPAALYEPPRRPKPRSRANRVAASPIAASLASFSPSAAWCCSRARPRPKARARPRRHRRPSRRAGSRAGAAEGRHHRPRPAGGRRAAKSQASRRRQPARADGRPLGARPSRRVELRRFQEVGKWLPELDSNQRPSD